MLGKLFAKVKGDVYETSLDGSVIKVHEAEPLNTAAARAVKLSRLFQAFLGDGTIAPVESHSGKQTESGADRPPTYTDQRLIENYGDERASDAGL